MLLSVQYASVHATFSVSMSVLLASGYSTAAPRHVGTSVIGWTAAVTTALKLHLRLCVSSSCKHAESHLCLLFVPRTMVIGAAPVHARVVGQT